MNQDQDKLNITLNYRKGGVIEAQKFAATNPLLVSYNAGIEQDNNSKRTFISLASLLANSISADSSYITRSIETAGGDIAILRRTLEAINANIPPAKSGQALDEGCHAPIFLAAQAAAEKMGDEFVNTDHLILALLNGVEAEHPTAVNHAAQLSAALSNAGLTAQSYKKSVLDLRRGARIKTQFDGENFGTLGLYTKLIAAAGQERTPFMNRSEEMRRIEKQIAKTEGNSVWLTGEFGVGKTALVEAFAARLADGQTPRQLAGRKLLKLDLSRFIAGAGNELDTRFKALCDEAEADGDKILYIDEIERLLLDNGSVRASLAIILNDVVSRGQLPIIATSDGGRAEVLSTADQSLFKKFERIRLQEPSDDLAREMLYAHRDSIAARHGVEIEDEAIARVIKQTKRYQSDEKFPKKAIDALDEAASLVAIRAERPEVLTSKDEQLILMVAELDSLKNKSDDASAQRQKILQEQFDKLEDELTALEQQWENEQSLRMAVETARSSLQQSENKLQQLKQEREQLGQGQQVLQAANANGDNHQVAAPVSKDIVEKRQRIEADIKRAEMRDLPAQRTALSEAEKNLAALGDNRLAQLVVTPKDIDQALTVATGIPIGQGDDEAKYAPGAIEAALEKRVVGQKKAVSIVAEGIRRAKKGLNDAGKPLLVVFFAGPSGVGKTELAKATAEFEFGGEDRVIRYDMGEYTEPHTVSTLLGAPPGYQGSEQGGKLVNDINNAPYSVLLFDEIEKAHPSLFPILLKLLDEGKVTDRQHNTADARNCIIVMTSNVGKEYFEQFKNGSIKTPEELNRLVKEAYNERFPVELRGRISSGFTIFNSLDPKVTRMIIPIQTRKLNKLMDERQVKVALTPSAEDWLAKYGYDPNLGARPLNNLYRDIIVNGVAKLVTDGMLLPGQDVSVDVQPQKVTVQSHITSAEEIMKIVDGLDEFKPTIQELQEQLQKLCSKLSYAELTQDNPPVEEMHEIEVPWPTLKVSDRLRPAPAINIANAKADITGQGNKGPERPTTAPITSNAATLG